ncbi:MAG: hypothetical protein L0216_00155 [Planctomycetales bacterium]|nr:hypothetical protein [Planctomycetales bacterium]
MRGTAPWLEVLGSGLLLLAAAGSARAQDGTPAAPPAEKPAAGDAPVPPAPPQEEEPADEPIPPPERPPEPRRRAPAGAPGEAAPPRLGTSLSVAVLGCGLQGEAFDSPEREWDELYEGGGAFEMEWRLHAPLRPPRGIQLFAGPAVFFSHAEYEAKTDFASYGDSLAPGPLYLWHFLAGGHLEMRTSWFFLDAHLAIGTAWIGRVHAVYDPAGAAGPQAVVLLDRTRTGALAAGMRLGAAWELEGGGAMAVYLAFGSVFVGEPDSSDDPNLPASLREPNGFAENYVGIGVTIRVGVRGRPAGDRS